MKKMLMLLLLAALPSLSISAKAQLAQVPKTNFTVAWSVYAGWMPWGYAYEKGVVDKWAKKYGITIKIVKDTDYIASIETFMKGGFDGCAMTNMDAFTMPAATGVDTTAIILGDYSNGNDAVVLKNTKDIQDIKNRNVTLVANSVSHYLLLRALEKNGMKAADVKVVNASDLDIVLPVKKPSVTAATLWNPQLSYVLGSAGNMHKVFTSRDVPGEIIDMMVVNTETLKKNPALGKALVGAWFEIMNLISKKNDEAKIAKQFMAVDAGSDIAEFESHLRDTELFYSPNDAYRFAHDNKLKDTMMLVRNFAGIINTPNHEGIGVQFPDGTVSGNKDKVRLRFDTSYMGLAKENLL